MTSVVTENATAPGGHYVQAMKSNGFVFVSGILGIHQDDEKITLRSFEDQTRICLQNLEAILAAAGVGIEHVVKTTIYVDDVANWGVANTIYAEKFGAHRPARAIVPVPGLHHGLGIEIEAIAVSAQDSA